MIRHQRDVRRTFDPASVGPCFRARCLASCRPVLRRVGGRFVTGARAGIRLQAPAMLRLPPDRGSARFRRHNKGFSAETASLYRHPVPRCGACAVPLHAFPARFLACPVPPRRSDPSIEPTCLWPKPPACRLQIGAWTDVTAILGIKTSGSSEPCGLPFRLVCVPKTA